VIEVRGRDVGLTDLKRLAFELVHMEGRMHVAERDREIVRIHLAAENSLERAPLPP